MAPPPPEIKNPRRILILGLPSSGKLTLLKNLSSPLPTPIPSDHAGLTSTLPLKTPYYTTTLPIWLETLPPPSELSTFTSDYLSPAAAPVLSAIGAWIYTFTSFDSAVLRALEKVVGNREVVCLAVKKRGEVTEEEEEEGRRRGFEVVAGEGRGRNDWGELVGAARVREALEANEWEGDDDAVLDDDDEEFGELEGGDGKEEEDGLKFVRDEMEQEMAGLRMDLEKMGTFWEGREEEAEEAGKGEEGEESEMDVEKMEAAMLRLTALKEMGDDVSPEERRRLAGQAISALMK